MPRKRNRPTRNSTAHTASAPGTTPHPVTQLTHRLLLLVGLVLLIAAIVPSYYLVRQQLHGYELPGCGPDSPCAKVTGGFWGSVRFGSALAWPVSFLGLAYFCAAAGAWLTSGGFPAALVRWVFRCGGFVSLFFIGLMLWSAELCASCLSAHVPNLLFVALVEGMVYWPRRPPALRRAAVPLGTFALLGVLVSLALGLAQAQVRAAAERTAEASHAESVAAMVDRTRQPTQADPAAPSTQPTTAPASRTAFTGRFRWGPENAPIRIVLFTGYQCNGCAWLENQVLQLKRTRSDISLSIKHFPLNRACNEFVTSSPQTNGCWAARAAETAGLLRGVEGFWQMHEWLFARQGGFTDRELNTQLQQFGYDIAEFNRIMQSNLTLERVRADTVEAIGLGLHQTPMVFINGVELKGWNAPNSLIRAVEALAATEPPPGSPFDDQPPAARDKFVSDWLETRPRVMIPLPQAPAYGATVPRFHIIVFGDFQERWTVVADQVLRAFTDARDDVRYEFRLYPFNVDCNPHLPAGDRRHPEACRAGRAALAALRLGGPETYWRVHAWLSANREAVSEATLRAAAPQFGLDADAFFAAMNSTEIESELAAHVANAKQHNVTGVPWIFINGRRVTTWQHQEIIYLQDILAAAVAEE